MTIATDAPSQTPFDRLGGMPAFVAIADRFYDLMEQDPAYARLRAMHAVDLAPMRKALASFLAGWAGGPRDWFEANPGRCMVSLHQAFPIGRDVADQWAGAMQRAIADVSPPSPEVAAFVSETLAKVARGMVR